MEDYSTLLYWHCISLYHIYLPTGVYAESSRAVATPRGGQEVHGYHDTILISYYP